MNLPAIPFVQFDPSLCALLGGSAWAALMARLAVYLVYPMNPEHRRGKDQHGRHWLTYSRSDYAEMLACTPNQSRRAIEHLRTPPDGKGDGWILETIYARSKKMLMLTVDLDALETLYVSNGVTTPDWIYDAITRYESRASMPVTPECHGHETPTHGHETPTHGHESPSSLYIKELIEVKKRISL